MVFWSNAKVRCIYSVAAGPAAPGAAVSALAVVIGELIQVWSLTVATAAVSNAMYSQFNSQNSSSSSSGSGNSSGDNKGTENPYTYENGTYGKADYHSGQTTGKKDPAPKDGQFALDNSLSIGENTSRRVGLDSNGRNQGLTQEMKMLCIKQDM